MKAERTAEVRKLLRRAKERAEGFSGWTFESLRVRNLDGGEPWDYIAEARARAAKADRVVDLDTGGGERFAEIAEGLPGQFVGVEPWVVNAPVAAARLRPLGIPVVRAECEGTRLPFRNGAFNLVLSRHGAIEPAEVMRTLARGGAFVTQQVEGDNWAELRPFFPRKVDFGDHGSRYRQAFERAGYRCRLEQHRFRVAYGDIGELAFMLLIAPWEIPDLDIENDFDALCAVEEALGRPEGIVLTEGRYLLIAEDVRGPAGLT